MNRNYKILLSLYAKILIPVLLVALSGIMPYTVNVILITAGITACVVSGIIHFSLTKDTRAGGYRRGK